MTPYIVLGFVLGLAIFAFGFYIGNNAAMRSVRVGAKWKLNAAEQRELDRLMEKALAKRGEE